jgi:tetratricopeptide (TPR) repeat protein
MGAPRALALCHCFRGALDFQTGDWEAAESALRQAIELYRQVGSASGESFSLQRLGVLLTARGDADAARELLHEGIAVAERASMRSHCLTRLHAAVLRNRMAAGDIEGVRSSLVEGLEAARRHGHCVTCNALLLPEVVRAQLVTGDVDGADGHATQLEQIAADFQSRAWIAMASQARGRVLLARQNAGAAHDEFSKAREAFSQIGQIYDAARCMLRQAESLRLDGPGEDARAADLESEAHRIFDSLGAAGQDI